MKIAVISDIHDNVWNLEKALKMPELQATETLLCAGDLCAPFIVKLLGQGYAKPIHLVLGNNDGDVAAIISNASAFDLIRIHGEYYRGELGGKTFAMNHYPDKARTLAQNGGFDAVIYGHDHTLSVNETIGNSRLINPGTLMGFHGGSLKTIAATFVILDTRSWEIEVFEV